MPIARFLVRRRGRVALAWSVVLVTLIPQARRAAALLETGARVEGSEAAAVEQLMSGPLATSYARFAVLVVTGAPSPTTPGGAAVLQRILEPLDRMPGVTRTFSWLTRPDSLFLAANGEGFFVAVGLSSASAADQMVPPLRALTGTLAQSLQAEYPDIHLRWTGESPLNVDLRRASGADIRRAEMTALPLTLGLLLLGFGAIAASLLPIISGTLAITISLGAAALLARALPLSILLQSVVTMLGLGLGIDYALLMVNRFREARAAGETPEVAAETALRHAGHTIFLSAATVALGLAALLTVPRNDMRAIGVGGLLVVTASALLATTLLPGILSWCGPRIEWGRLHGRARGPKPDRWWRWGAWVTGHPWTALIAGLAPLLLLAAQAFGLRTGQPRGHWMPATMESIRALDDLGAMGRRGVVQMIQVVLELPDGVSLRRSSGWQGLTGLAQSLEADPRVARVRSLASLARDAGVGRSVFAFLPDSVMQGLVSANSRLARLEVLPRESARSEDLDALVRDIRRTGADRAGLAGARVLVGGGPGFNADYQDAVTGRFRSVAILVIATTLVALLAGFRSILVPVKAVALNLLSVASAFGALTIVFQYGHGGWLFGVDEPVGAVYASLPVMVFCIVFGLSMDYEVFLISRVQEARNAGRDERGAIVEAVGTTGRVITSAAAIMLVVFAAFTLGEFLLIKMLGFALAVAVLLDATVIRMLIGPALLQLAGQWNWWPGSTIRAPAVPTRA